MKRLLPLLLLTLFPLALACNPMPNPEDFDDSCVTEDDCVGIYTGDPCAGCQCADTAISQDALADWQEARGEPFCPAAIVTDQCLCAAPMLVCEEGRCEIGG
jgi:hypothetical protein